jgi:hypothetical protein
MGGRATDEPLNTQKHALADWEVLADAVTVALGHKGIRSTDESNTPYGGLMLYTS